jgi:hypothetical protein
MFLLIVGIKLSMSFFSLPPLALLKNVLRHEIKSSREKTLDCSFISTGIPSTIGKRVPHS